MINDKLGLKSGNTEEFEHCAGHSHAINCKVSRLQKDARPSKVS